MKNYFKNACVCESLIFLAAGAYTKKLGKCAWLDVLNFPHNRAEHAYLELISTSHQQRVVSDAGLSRLLLKIVRFTTTAHPRKVVSPSIAGRVYLQHVAQKLQLARENRFGPVFLVTVSKTDK